LSLHAFFDEPSDLDWFNQGNANSTGIGIKVGYRRVAGKIGLTTHEGGTRGAWVDKRVGLFKWMFSLGYNISLLSEGTEHTRNEGVNRSETYHGYDILCLEFGGTNMQFYGKEWMKTVDIIANHKDKLKIFICDDPDLSFLWELLPADEDYSKWSIWANATNAEEVLRVLKAPVGVKCSHVAMDKYMEADSFSPGSIDKVVYIGRNSGRAAHFKTLGKSPYLQIAGKAKEWEDYPNLTLVDVPQQKDRRKFYRDYYGCLAIYDKKHKETGWHTGRAYHALYAGIPVLAPPGNNGLTWCYPINEPSDIEKFVQLSVEERQAIWKKQLDKVRE